MSKANNKKNRINKKSTNNFRIESLEPRFMMDASVDYETFTNAEHFQTEITEQLQNFETADLSNLGLNGAQVEASALFNGIATDAVQKFNTLQNQIASQLNDPDAGLSGIVRQDGEIVSVDKATLLSVLANMDISGLDISMDGDLVDVSYAYAGSGNLPQMSLDTLDMAVAANDSLSIGATVNIQYNLLDNGTAVTNPGASVTVRDLFAHIGNVGGTARFMNLNVLEIADSGNSPMDVHLGFDENNPSVDLDLEFQLAANNGFPFEFNNTTDSIKVGLDDNDEIYVELPELKLANGFDDFSMTHIIEGIDFSQVPFISNPKFKVDGVEKSIPEIVVALQNYWAKCSFAVSGAVQQVQGGNGYQIDFSRVQNLFSLIQGSSTGGVLKSLTVGDKTENRTCVLGNSKQEATSLFLTFVPNIDIINESLDFGLLNLSGLTVESSISVELKVFVDASGNLCFDDFSLDEFKLDVKKTNISGTVNLGLFNAEITNGNFLLSIEKNNGADLQTNVSFNFDSAQLKSGSVNVLSLPVKNGEGGVVVPYTFKYDGVQNNWDVPIELKKYTSLSGETLVNQVQIYLNSLQTTLRSAIEDRLKLDFLGDSADKIVDIIDKVEKVVYGGYKEGDETVFVAGLLKKVDATYQKNFDSVESFVTLFNTLWTEFLGVSNVCSMKYVGENLQQYSFVDEGAMEIPADFQLKNYLIAFNLGFGLDKYIELNLSKSLGSSFANVTTEGVAKISGTAGLQFTLSIVFEAELLGETTTLGEIGFENHDFSDEKYFYLEDDNLFDLNNDLSFNLIDSGKNSLGIVSATIGKVKEKIGDSSWNVSVTGFSLDYSEDNRILIIGNQEFDVVGSESDIAFLSLGLTNTNLQTPVEKTISDSWTEISFDVYASDSMEPIAFQVTKNELNRLSSEGIILATDLKGQLNEYLSLQLSDSESDEIQTWSNKYGLYVLDVKDLGDGNKKIRFACDNSRLLRKTDPSASATYKIKDGESYNYLRMSSVLRANAEKSDGNEYAVFKKDGVTYFYNLESNKYSSSEADHKISDINSFLSEHGLTNCFNVSKIDIGTDQFSITVSGKPVVDTSSNSVTKPNVAKVSHNVISINAKKDNVDNIVLVDTAGCLTASNLAVVIRDAFKANELLNDNYVKSVSFENDTLVLTTASDVVVESSLFGNIPYSSLDDVKIKNAQSERSVDFESDLGSLLSSTTLSGLVSAINSYLNPESEPPECLGVTLHYCDNDGTENTENWDHLEFRSANAFSIESMYQSKILEKLGFSSGTAFKYNENDYRIVGSTLLGCDWSKQISFAKNSELNVYADASFSIVHSEEDAQNPAVVKASLGFMGVELDVDGQLDVHASFGLELYEDSSAEGPVALRYKLTPEFTVGNVEGNPNNALSFDIKVDGLGLSENPTMVGSGTVSLSYDLENGFETATSYSMGEGFESLLTYFSSFSIEKLYTALDSLAKRIAESVDGSNQKIPVINKSVSDMVNVANDIRDVISKLRRSNITSFQELNTFLVKAFRDCGISIPTSCEKIFEIVDDDEGGDETQYNLLLNLNFEKEFSSVQKFHFGGTSCGISGNADLNVQGKFWLDFSAKVNIGINSFDLQLTEAIKFGADVNIVGEKLSFNLGIDSTDSSLLANLITVGSNDSNAFVVAQASLIGKYGNENDSFATWDLSAKPVVTLPVAVYGVLPISACNYSLGKISFGKLNGGAVISYKDLNEAKSTFDTHLNAYKDSWLKPSTAPDCPLQAIDVSKADFGFDLLGTEQETSAATNVFAVDMNEVYQELGKLGDLENMDWFDKIKLAVTGLNTLFDTLESSLNSNLAKNIKSVPVVGDTLSTGVDFLSKLKDSVLDPFSQFVYESTGLTAEMVARQMNSLFGEYLIEDNTNLSVLDGSIWSRLDNKSYYRSGNKEAEWFFRLGGEYDYGQGIGFDFGFPGLSLDATGGLNLKLNWSLEFGFGVSEDKGFYLILGDQNEIDVSAEIDFAKTSINGSLAGLGMSLSMGTDTWALLNFGIDLGDGYDEKFSLTHARESLVRDVDTGTVERSNASEPEKYGRVDLARVIGNLPTFNYEAYIHVQADISVGISKDVAGNTPKFPTIGGQFVFEAGKLLEEESFEIDALGFHEMNIELGSFVNGVLGPIVSKIQQVVEPLKPLIDFLTTPFPVLDDLGIVITPLDLAKQYSKGKFDDSMIYAIKDLIALSEKITQFGDKNPSIDIGSMDLVGGSGDEDAAEDFLNGKISSEAIGAVLENGYLGLASDASVVQEQISSTLSGNGLNVGDGSWTFIWDNPSDIFKLLLGQDITLVHYNMPKLSFDFDWDTFIRIWGPLGARLGVAFNASIDLAFGYDTLGIRQWVKSDYKDYGRLLNGFYVDDLDEKGNDKNELSFYGGLTAAAELNAGVSAGVGGGVGINVGFNLYDPNKDGKIRLNEITELFKSEGLFGFFDVNGAITAKLYAYVDLLFYTKKWNITDDITLFEFEFKHKTAPIMISKSGDDVVANIGSNASSRVATNDLNKTLDDGDETLVLTLGKDSVSDKYGHEESITDGKLIINAEQGNDNIYLKSGDPKKPSEFDIIINGGDGNDIIDLSDLYVAAGYYVLITGGAGADNITGAHGLNIIFGDTGTVRVDKEKDENEQDVYRLVAEANVDANQAGGDTILGNSGHDIIFGGAGDDQVDGGDGVDYIFGDGGSWSILTNENDVVAALHEISNGIVKDNVRISRTDISLDGGKDTLIGGDGDDVIYGGGGDDHIDGGAGNDLIYGERGHDRILGGSDDDTIHGGEGMDIVFGDRIEGQSKNVAKPFDKNTTSESTSDAAFSQEFIDAQFAKDGPDKYKIAQGEFEFDIKKLSENGSVSTIHMSNTDSSEDNGSDIIYGDDGNDLLFGDDGSDTNENGGADKIFGGIGNDIIDGDGGNDTISGGIDNDIIYGGLGDDNIDGGAGNDMLYGDNGVTDYLSSSITDGNELTAQPGVDDKIVFGDNYGLHGKIYANAKSQTTGGNDKITTGPGMDFVDGQRGNDKVFVNLMGDSTTNYANVTDSGEDEGEINTLTVEGTENNDLLLMRRSTDGKLGFVALLPNSNIDDSMNSNIERVNFTRNVNAVNLNANGGDDKIFVDGTAKKTNIDAGAGNDKIHIGQVYKSKRDSGDYAKVAEDDHFETVETDDGLFLSTGVTKDTSLNVEGGLGTDNFISLNNVGRLSMNGGRGNDNFTIYGFSDVNGDVIEKGSNSIDGGEGDDSLFVRGTNGDDTVVVTKDGTLSNMVGVKAAGVEKTTFDAAGGDDMFYVLGSREDQVTELNGGKGNDTFTTGGLDEDKVLRSSETDGQACYVEYEVLTSDGLDATQQAARDTAFDTAKVIADKFNIVDTSNVPAVFITDSDNRICSDISINEGTASDFYVRYAGDIKGGSIKVTLGAPVLSNTAFMQGDRGVMIALVDGNENVVSYGETVSFTLDSTHQSFHVRVIAFNDKLAETESVKSVSVESFWTRTEQNESVTSALSASVSALAVTVGNSADSASNQLLCYSEEFRYTGNPVQLGEWAKKLPQGYSMQVCAVGEDGVKSSTLNTTTGILTINDPSCNGKTLVVNVRSNSMRIDGSKAILAYDEIQSLTVEYNGVAVPVAGASQNTTGIYYRQNGNVLVFYNADNNRFVTLHGILTVTGTIASSTNSASEPPATPTEPQNMSPAVVVSSHADTLVEYASDSHNSVQCSVGLNQTVAAGKTVYVKVSTKELAFAKDVLEQDGSLKKNKQVTLSAEGVTPESDGSLILAFTSEKTSYIVTVSAIADAYREDYGLTTVTAGNDKTIAEIDGPVYAYGEGKSIDVDLDNPELLKYEHKIQASTQNVDASDYNEKNNYDMGSLFVARSVAGNVVSIALSDNQDLYASIFEKLEMDVTDEATFFKKTLKFIPTGAGTVEESGWFQIEDCSIADGVVTLTLNDACGDFSESNSKIMLSGNKDYLFQDEATMVDRLFVNNQDDKNAKTSSLNAFTSMTSGSSMVVEAENQVPDFDAHAVRFNHSDLAAEGITAAQMEYAEYNLGSGSDTVNVNKTIYREDGFQTFTVVNTGSGVTGGNATDDTVNINSYAEESATEIASGTSAVLSGTADNGGATYNYTLTGSAEAFNVAKSALDVSEKIYVDATLSDGTTQRREVTTLEQLYFVVARAFTLANGVAVVSVSFKHGYSGDGQLVVNAQDGDDIINATSNAVTRNDMVVFGGLGDDTINMNRGGIAFGDRGQVLYGEDPQNPVTVLGSTNSGLDYTTGISKNHGDDTAANGPVHRLQTDGVRRGAYEIHSMNDSEGGSDTINVGGTDSVVIGGADGDTITVSGNNNIALGDNGSVKYYNAANVGAVYGDSLNLGLHTVETTSDSVGDVDTVTISGNKNVAMGGEAGDTIGIGGSDNVVIGDGGRYTVLSDRLIAESKSDTEGGSDTITTGDGKNAIIGGTDADTITTGAGNDIIVGDGGKVIMDTGRNALMVTNKDRNITAGGLEDGSAGGDTIDAGNGRNVVFGGLDSDHIKTGEGEDVVFGDNGFATFQGNAAESGVETRTEATLSFNFQGASQTGLSSEAVAGALNATHGDDYRSANWNNVGGNLAGTYGNDDREVVRFDDGTRASAVSVSYGGIESHRNTDTDNRINLQAYGHNFANASTDADAALMNAGLMTTAPNAQCDNRLEVVVDGLAQYFTEYRVVVYLDIPDSHSAYEHSVRKVSLYVGDSSAALQSFYVDDAEGENFDGGYERATATTASAATYANYAVFTVSAASFADSFRVVIEDAFPDQHPNGKNLPGIAAIQVRGDLHAQDVAVSTQLNLGGDDIVSTGGGDDIVVGGAGSDYMATFGELAGGIRDNDLVFGDSASLRFEDRLGTGDTMVSSARSLDPDAADLVQGVSFDDRIVTGDGNDTVVGGLGGDKILAGSQSELTQLGIAQAFYGEDATAESLDAANGPAAIRDLEQLKDATVEGRKVLSVNFTTRGADDSTMASGHAGVVHDTGWNNLYLYNGHLYTHEGNENSTTPVLRYSNGGTVTDSSVGISLSSYDSGTTDQGQNGSLVFRTSTELDGDTANSRLFAGYTAAQQQQDIHVSLTNLSSFRGAGGTCDVYVYLGADDSDTDAHSHIYEIQGSEDGSRYLNDWKGHAFDGDYREATCRSRSDALANLASGATPMVELIGNYVVFHGVAGDSFDLYIRNLHTEGGQWPMNMPVIAAIQVVAGSGRADAAVGGDHDRDLVFGDSAALTFDMDVPYAAGEDLADFANINRVNGASSVALDDGLYALGADDAIYTGMDRDVVVAGEGLDTVTLGSGDDVALGDNASLVLEHNNPVGVFRPDVETVLESNNYQADNAAYLGSPTVDAGDIQDKFEDGDVPGVTLEASANGGTDTFTDATDKDWTVQQEVTPGELSEPIDVPAAGVPVEFREGDTVLLRITPSSPWYQHRLQIGTEGGGTIPPLTLEWVVDGVTVTESVSNPYWNEKELPANPNAGTYYEIRVTALAAGNAKFTFI